MKNERVVILGNFDGVHIGHQALVSEGRRIADELGCALTAWTFDSVRSLPLCSKSDREELLLGYGADEVIFASFDEVKGMTPERFVKEILFSELNAKVAVCGYNYSFGAGGKGTPELLAELCSMHGISVTVVDKVSKNGVGISSSLIRELISKGNVEEATSLLGRPFYVKAEVTHGAGLGRTVGIPTVNFDVTDFTCLPKFGVYATLTHIDGKRYTSVTNVGVRPTVSDNRGTTVETHILDFDGDLYGKTVKVEFLSFIRDESVFSSIEALSEQISLDASVAKKTVNKFLEKE